MRRAGVVGSRVLGSRHGSDGAGGSARRRAAGQRCGDHGGAVERRRSLRASRGLDRMVLGFRGSGGDGACLALLSLGARGGVGSGGVT